MVRGKCEQARPDPRFRVERHKPIKWAYYIICICGKAMNAAKDCHYHCKCGQKIHNQFVELLIKEDERR